MRITFIVADDRPGDGWTEDYETDKAGAPEEIIGALLENFNNTLRPGERARHLVRIVSAEATAPKPFVMLHRWEKQNLVTIIDKHGVYDKMKCRICGAMGKRHGVGEVTPDKKFPEVCPGYDL